MSTIYPDLTCNFPNSIDPNKTFSDVTSTTKDLVNQYYTYKEAGNDSAAIDILTQNPDLKNTIITHEVIQLIYDMCIAQQRFYTSDVRNTLTTIVHYKGAFNETTKYSMFDLVTYNYRAYLCNSSDVAVGTLPTASGWDRITFQGESGTGMAFYTTWDNAQAYKVQDCVPYSNKLYVCVQANTNQTPLNNPTYWASVITAPKQIIISPTQPENQDENDIWYNFNSADNSFESYKKNSDGTYSKINYKVDANYIQQNANNRFVDDIQKSSWNEKANYYQTSVTIPVSGWSLSPPYSNTINLSGFPSNLDFHQYLVPAIIGKPTEKEQDSFNDITGAITTDTSVTFYCRDDKPDTTITVRLEAIQ